MFKVVGISHSPQMKNIASTITKPLETVAGHTANSATELCRTTSEAVTSIQKALLSLKERPHLNLDSEAVEFFGLKSYEDMAIAANIVEMFTNFKIDKLKCMSLAPESSRDSFRRGSSSLITLFKELNQDCGSAKMTFYDECFDGALHTIGFVRNKDTMYVLDSLGNNAKTNPDIMNFHCYIDKLLSAKMHESGLKKVIFNSDSQQSMNEITCNHWTFANIEALTKALKSGKTIEDSTSLDGVLPHDINKVLNEQMNFVLNKACSISL